MESDFEVLKERLRQEKRLATFVQGDELTGAGIERVKDWASEMLTYDSTAELSYDELAKSFASFGDADDRFEVPWNCMRSFVAVTADALVYDDEESPKNRDEALGRSEYFIRARFQDALNAEHYSPFLAPERLEFLVDDLLPLNSVHVLVALPETLKTWTAYSIALAVSRGKPWLGRYHTRKGRAAIISFEMDRKEPFRRLRMLGASENDRASLLIVSHPPYNLNDDRFWIELAKLQANMIVIDSLAAGSGGDVGELDSRFADPLRRAERFIAKHAKNGEKSCTIIFTHHSPKTATLRDAESLFRGTGATRGACDTALYFERLPSDDGSKKSRITPVKTRKGGDEPPPFTVRLTDANGLELVAPETKKARTALPEMSDADRVFKYVTEHPSTNVTDIASALKLRRATVVAAKKALGVRLRTEGKGPATRLYAELEAVPESVPADGSGTDSTEQIESGATENQ